MGSGEERILNSLTAGKLKQTAKQCRKNSNSKIAVSVRNTLLRFSSCTNAPHVSPENISASTAEDSYDIQVLVINFSPQEGALAIRL